jgi:hypothetical protein
MCGEYSYYWDASADTFVDAEIDSSVSHQVELTKLKSVFGAILMSSDPATMSTLGSCSTGGDM